MAIDTAAKRLSILNLNYAMLPGIPDTSIDDEDRQALAYAYSGIASLEPQAPEDVPTSSKHQKLRIRNRG